MNSLLNSKLINEFSKFISYLKEQSDDYQQKKQLDKVKQNSFRIKAASVVLSVLKKIPDELTLENYKDKLSHISGIGKGSLERIHEILSTGKLKELGDFVDTKKDKKNSLENLEEIVGIGRAHALELYDKGITSVEILKEKINKKEITVNDKILLGLKYYGKYKMNIPRSEMEQYKELLLHLTKKINKSIALKGDKNEYVLELCGSYRREKLTSNDIDVLISKKGTTHLTKTQNHLERFVNKLKKPMKYNNNQPLLIDSMTDKKIKTKYMGFSQLLNNPPRRIDIRFINYDSYPAALLYFTGSSDLNKKMRQIAKEKGYKLSEYGLFNKQGELIKANSERDIFHILGMEYLVPRLR
jgi:DNA polymerase/3'-5' exonuclease PolX